MIGIDGWALLIVIAGMLLFIKLRPKQEKRGGIPVATLASFGEDFSLRHRWRHLPMVLLWMTLGFLLLAFVNIHWTVRGVSPESPTEGVALYLVVDRSRSMGQPVIGGGTKLEALKEVSRQFVVGRPNDLIGLIAFARTAEVLTPLTLDHRDVALLLEDVSLVRDLQQDGTAIGYAIYKGVNLFTVNRQQSAEGGYTISSEALVVVTDGFQDPHPEDRDNRLRSMGLEEAASFANKMGVKLYIISIDPRLSLPDFAPQQKQLEAVSALTGGELFQVESTQDLASVFSVINTLEKSPIYQRKQVIRTWGTAPFFMTLGLMTLFGSVVLGTTVLRRVP